MVHVGCWAHARREFVDAVKVNPKDAAAINMVTRIEVGNVVRHLGEMMAIEVTDKTVNGYQTARLRETAAPKTINEEVGFY